MLLGFRCIGGIVLGDPHETNLINFRNPRALSIDYLSSDWSLATLSHNSFILYFLDLLCSVDLLIMLTKLLDSFRLCNVL